MHYTKEQIELLGIRPRERKYGKDGKCDLLPCEARECKAVVKDLLKSDELWEYWRLIPFEEGYACQRRKEFERWIADEVYNMWWDIGIPKFHEDGSWSCDCGWWPYLKTRYLDVCWMQVGNALIDMDEVFTTIRNHLEEMVRGYRMCPGLALYRVVREWIKEKRRGNSDSVVMLEKQIADLAKDYPTKTSERLDDREYYSYEL